MAGGFGQWGGDVISAVPGVHAWFYNSILRFYIQY